MRLLTIFSLAIAVLVSVRVFTFFNIGTPEAVKAAQKFNKTPTVNEIKYFNNINAQDSLKALKIDVRNIK